MQPNPTLDQLQVFLAVAETGSFSAASRSLNRAQSVVSYTIANLETQLEVELFDRNGSRQPRLTEAGRAMLEDARRIVSDIQVMRARAKGLRQGLEGEVVAAINVVVPTDAVVGVLREFRALFPSVSLRLHMAALGEITELVAKGQANFGISSPPVKQDDTLITERIGHTFMVPVVSAEHVLAQIEGPVTLADVREEVQIVVTDASSQTKGRDFNVFSYRIWRVSDMFTKYQLIRGGLGWGGLPGALVCQDLKAGRLVRLQLDAYGDGLYPLHAITAAANPPGPAAAWMIDRFRAVLSACPTSISSDV